MCPNTIASLSRGMPQLWFLLLQYYEKRTQHNTTCHNYFQVNQLLYPNQGILLLLRAKVESSRTSLASRTSSRTHFEVLGLGLEALGPRKLPCPRLEYSTIFEPLKFCWKRQKPHRKFVNTFFYFAQLERRLSQAGLPPPNWNFINDKNVTKKPIVSSVSVSF